MGYLVAIVGQVGEDEVEEGEEQDGLVEVAREGEVGLEVLDRDRVTGKMKEPILVTQ